MLEGFFAWKCFILLTELPLGPVLRQAFAEKISLCNGKHLVWFDVIYSYSEVGMALLQLHEKKEGSQGINTFHLTFINLLHW